MTLFKNCGIKDGYLESCKECPFYGKSCDGTEEGLPPTCIGCGEELSEKRLDWLGIAERRCPECADESDQNSLNDLHDSMESDYRGSR